MSRLQTIILNQSKITGKIIGNSQYIRLCWGIPTHVPFTHIKNVLTVESGNQLRLMRNSLYYKVWEKLDEQIK